eukprot:CAMPEP_0182572376 /NCGR_PEP_ID=MMETSP1324-20130603/16097_1 /TAXON_ID=236786 /ORGANISM="Florenciella sp., Strain RCC1587" /LENGTH=1350 /DNA_ID=CAMNT_0024787249 /DNA_START=68 /DNA_END=4120 /DNA_ORIENTATION=+
MASAEAIPREFSQGKEAIDNKIAGDGLQAKKDDDSGEALMMAMACESTAMAGQKKHSCSIIDLIQKEFGVDMGITITGGETEDEMKAKESECVTKYMEMGLSSNSQKVLDGIGGNQLTPPEGEHPCWTFWKHQFGIFSLLLWGGSFLCFIAYGLDTTDLNNLYLGSVLGVVVFLTGIFEYMQEADAAKTMEGFADMLPQQANVVRDGKSSQIPATDLVAGDVMTVNMGDKIPADLRMLSVTNLKIEQSSLTGEPDAIAKDVGTFEENPLESKNVAFFGTSAEAGTCTAVVVLVGDGTIMGNIASLAAGGDRPPTPINLEIHRFIKIVSGIALMLGLIFGIVCIIQDPADYVRTLVFVIGIIVANVPEGLLATVTVSLTLTAVKLGKVNVNVKDLEGVETLGSTTCICSDKTGTLTQNKMTSNHIYLEFSSSTDPDSTYEVNALTSSELGDPTPGFDFTDPALAKLLMTCNLVNACVFDTGKVGTGVDNLSLYIQARECLNGNASDIAFFKFAEGCLWKKDGLTLGTQPETPAAEAMRVANPTATVANSQGATQKLIIPFNSRYKFMVSVNWVMDPVQGKLRPAVLMKGAAEQIFQRCGTYVKGSEVVPIDQAKVDHFVKVYDTFGGAGERVIGFAMKYLDEDSSYSCAQTDADTPDEMTVGGVPLDASGEPIKPDATGYYAIGSQQFLDWGGPDNETNCMDKCPPPATPAFDALTFVGLISLIDPPREAVPPSVLQCRRAGVKVVMVTGDHPKTAAAIARMVNIIQPTAETIDMYAERTGFGKDLKAAQAAAEAECAKLDLNLAVNRHMRYTKSVVEARVIPGHELKTMTPDQVKEAFMYRDLVFARTSPEQKLKIVNAAQDMGHVVAVTGDGVNDSPALRGADIGCAMGIAGTDVSKEAADMILMTDDFSAIVLGIEEGRLIFDNLKKSIAYTLSSNIPEISPFLMYIITQMPLSLSTVLILCVDLGTDMVPAISLAYEKAESDIMERPPRDQHVDHLVTVKLVSFAYLQIGVFQALGGFYSFFVVMNDYGFKMRTVIGSAGVLGGASGVAFAKDGDKISSECPCGGGLSWDDYAKDAGFKLSSVGMVECSASKGDTEKCNGAGSNDLYVEIQTDTATGARYLETDTKAYTMLEDVVTKDSKYADMTSFLTAKCDVTSDDFGVTWTKNDDWYPLASKSMTPDGASQKTKWSPNNWPYGFGCPYGALRPSQYCKYPETTFVGPNPCYKGIEALRHAQTAAFVSIVIVQWADLIICKTRILSIYHQGMENKIMLIGLTSETLLCCALAYIPGLHQGLFTRDIMFNHWTPSMPFSILIFLYDETRKYLIRTHKAAYKGTPNEEGWLERYTYY